MRIYLSIYLYLFSSSTAATTPCRIAYPHAQMLLGAARCGAAHMDATLLLPPSVDAWPGEGRLDSTFIFVAIVLLAVTGSKPACTRATTNLHYTDNSEQQTTGNRTAGQGNERNPTRDLTAPTEPIGQGLHGYLPCRAFP